MSNNNGVLVDVNGVHDVIRLIKYCQDGRRLKAMLKADLKKKTDLINAEIDRAETSLLNYLNEQKLDEVGADGYEVARHVVRRYGISNYAILTKYILETGRFDLLKKALNTHTMAGLPPDTLTEIGVKITELTEVKLTTPKKVATHD